MTVKIEKSKNGPYYEMTIDGKFAGNYDSVYEAAKEVEQMKESAENE